MLQKHEFEQRSFVISNSLIQSITSTIAAVLILSVFLPPSFASEIYEVHNPRQSTARSLLQAQQNCPVNFENLNYTIITSRCKGPRYPPKICCKAFTDLACPYADELNDQTNNCATTMFSYINLYGHYPPGLFANECRDSKRGLECDDSQSAAEDSSTSAASTSIIAHHPFHCLYTLVFVFVSFFLLIDLH